MKTQHSQKKKGMVKNKTVRQVGTKRAWELRISRGKLLYIGWINNKVQLYSTVNYVQYIQYFNILWQTIMEKNMKKNI